VGTLDVTKVQKPQKQGWQLLSPEGREHHTQAPYVMPGACLSPNLSLLLALKLSARDLEAGSSTLGWLEGTGVELVGKETSGF
jgi:hypothetical protein